MARNIAAYHGGKFDETSRSVTFRRDDETEEYLPEQIVAGGNRIEVWPIGSGIWIWDEVKEV